MKYLIIANWKCNPVTLNEAKRLFNSTERGVKSIKNVEVVICPPFIYLFSLIKKSLQQTIKIGTQDCFWEEKGAYTGEISPLMLKNLGCQYVIIGHSERRKYQKETDEMINKKIKTALSVGLKPILCIANLDQLEKGLREISEKIIIAYEPLFAIGTGKSCSIGRAIKMRAKIKYPFVLYGGSVNPKNAADYISKAGFQGLLVGNSSLKAKQFLEIITNVEKI